MASQEGVERVVQIPVFRAEDLVGFAQSFLQIKCNVVRQNITEDTPVWSKESPRDEYKCLR